MKIVLVTKEEEKEITRGIKRDKENIKKRMSTTQLSNCRRP